MSPPTMTSSPLPRRTADTSPTALVNRQSGATGAAGAPEDGDTPVDPQPTAASHPHTARAFETRNTCAS